MDSNRATSIEPGQSVDEDQSEGGVEEQDQSVPGDPGESPGDESDEADDDESDDATEPGQSLGESVGYQAGALDAD